MAKKKKEQSAPAGAPAWMATFSDLMNLLLCFFVILFAMSSVNEDKFQQLVASLSSSFSILPQGGSSIGEGVLVSSGASQLTELSEFFNNMGMNSEGDPDTEVQSAQQQMEAEGLKESEKMAEYIEEQLKEEKLDSQIEVTATSSYVELNINGGILFDTGKVELKPEARDLLKRVADIIWVYDDNIIEIMGHTDNVPIGPELRKRYEDNMVLSQYRAHSVYVFFRDECNFTAQTMKAVGMGEATPIASNDTAEGRAQNRRVEIRIYNIYNN